MNTNLTAPLNWLLAHSWQAGVLVLLVLLVQWVFRRHLTNRWRFALWWIVLLRLLLPFSPESTVSVFNFFHPSVQLPSTIQPIAPTTDESRDQYPSMDAALPGNVPESPDKFLPTKAPVLGSIQTPSHRFEWRRGLIPGLAGLWMAGVLVLTGMIWIQLCRFQRKLARAAQPAEAELRGLLEECRSEFHITRTIELLETDAVQSPALFGFIRLRLLLPRRMDQQFTRSELRYIFLHELAHVKRGDLWLNWLVTGLLILHWFNPLLWLGFARLRADRELACDELALLHAGDQAGTAYGETVVKLLEHLSRSTPIPGLVGILEDAGQMRRRIAMIADFHRPGRWSVLAVGLVAALAAAALTDAQSQKPPVTFGSVEKMPKQSSNEGTNSKANPAPDHDYDTPRNSLPPADRTATKTAPPTNLKPEMAWIKATTPNSGKGRTVIGQLTPDGPCITNFSKGLLKFEPVGDYVRIATELPMQPDGSFRAEGVPSGNYDIELTMPVDLTQTNQMRVFHSFHELNVPRVRDDLDASVVDWGQVRVLHEGTAAPNAEVRGIVLDPDGKPAWDTRVAIQVASIPLWLNNRGLEHSDWPRTALEGYTGEDGRFSLPRYADAQSVVVANSEGYAQVPLDQLEKSPQITLQKWSRIEGVQHGGRNSGTNQTVIMESLSRLRAWLTPPTFQYPDYDIHTITDASGHFVFTNVPPGAIIISRRTPGSYGDARNFFRDNQLAIVDVAPGTTIVTNIGGTGRRVTGRLKFSGCPTLDFTNGLLDLSFPPHQLFAKMNQKKTKEEREALLQTEEFKTAMIKPAHFDPDWQADESFIVEDVPAGHYGLMLFLPNHKPGDDTYDSSRQLTVPSRKDDNDDSIVDLGEIDMTKWVETAVAKTGTQGEPNALR